MRTAVQTALWIGVAVWPVSLGAQEEACAARRSSERLAALGVEVPPDTTARPDGYWGAAHGSEDRTVGVGYLDLAAGPWDWLAAATVPFYARPGQAEPIAWLRRGWWVTGGGEPPRPLTYRGMVWTEYEESNFIVTAARADGWIELWVDIGPIPRAASHGLVWTHRCLLDLDEAVLSLMLWEDVFLGSGAPPLSFRDEARHALRAGPGTEHARLDWIEGDDEVELLEIQGDWARARVSKPGRFYIGCMGETWAGREREGWIRWRDPERGSWLWYPTRGC